MLIDLQNVPEEGQVVDRVVPRDGVRLDEHAFAFASDVALSGRLEAAAEASARAFRLKGRISGRLDVECVRCLEQFVLDLDEAYDLLYLPHSDNVAVEDGSDDDGHALGEDDLAVAFYRDEKLDLGQMIYEQTLLSIPMKPLCRPDCQGLCPACGVNRNEASCDCTTEEDDPRWDGLKALLGS